jgi:micrococcal nuclease
MNLRATILAGMFACHLATASLAAQGDGYQWPVVGAIDGDTIKVHMPGLPHELQPVKVRVLGIDTPESGGRAKCARERELGAKASALTRFLINDARARRLVVTFSEIGWDKYGGRIDARVSIDGRSLGDTLISAGLARTYDGGKRAGWCES